MKKQKSIQKIALVLSLVMCFTVLLCSCKDDGKTAGTPTDVYTANAEMGEGAKTLTVKVTDDEAKEIVFTIHTDAETVGDALLENNLIAGDDSEYGLYVKYVNGVYADYDTNKTYWAFYQNGEYMMTGVDATTFESGASYELVYTKE